MEENTKKKRVPKRAVRKKAKSTEPVSVAADPAVALTAPAIASSPATETKKPRKSSKAKSVSKAKPVSKATSVSKAKSEARPKSEANTPKLIPHLPTFEQVQLRAYFISERRRKLGLPGDESHDWLAAERELSEELTV